ncbi:hypothetical protein MOX02_55660 [Methylobacterium oxalidis]|uniref:Uncharacterized protein n=1 Tax=Methylobacterium oxalidis TaxID=944322 RepID=A0A512JC40_9HYPH|nr:hypothetical protein MOX02_55660 [Methylobacterium oxalidis]GLS65766.1 hypothetical protein GCM10007888_41480 [Methylobacterium oxalidis]
MRLKDERDVSSTKWFEYRFMSPIEATAAFYEAYRRLFREAWRKNFHAPDTELKRGGPAAGLWSNGREFNSVWRARQIADGLGLPYEFFIREAIEAAMRRGAKRPPRPNQLYNVLGMSEIHARWHEQSRSLPLFSKLPQYRVEAFQGLPAQIAHQTWVVDNLKARLGRPYAIAQACFEQRVLPLERAEAEFSAHQMEQVRYESAGMTATPIASLKPSDFWPSCFGLPHAHDDASPICAVCHVRDGCGKVETQVRAKVVERYGSERPRDDEKRAQVRARVARLRAERKAAASPGAGASEREPGSVMMKM